MSKKIDPNSVYLGLTVPEYFAKYEDILPGDEPPECELVENIPPVPKTPEFLKLNPSCIYTFPDIVPLPPVFNPPPQKFLACEEFSATAHIDTRKATSGSYLIAKPTGPTACGVTLEGLFEIQACEEFTAKVEGFHTTGALTGTLNLSSQNRPNCAVVLSGELDVKACEEFDATVDIDFGNIFKKSGSFIHADKRSIPDCGLNITGLVDLLVCEDFDVTGSINISGPPVKSNTLRFTGKPAPECGLDLNGEVNIEACVDFDVTGNINISGPPVKSNTLRFTGKPAPDCGIDIAGDVDIQACVDFDASGNFSVMVGSSASGYLSIVPTSQPNCGITYDGRVVIPRPIFPCPAGMELEVQQMSMVTIEAQDPANKKTGEIKIKTEVQLTPINPVQKGYENSLDGYCGYRLDLNNLSSGYIKTGCAEIEIDTKEASQVVIPLSNYGEIEIASQLLVSYKNPCSIILQPKLTGSGRLKLPKFGVIAGTTMVGQATACEPQEALGIVVTGGAEEGFTVDLTGELPAKPCFKCDGENGINSFRDLELKQLDVNYIKASRCCAAQNSYVDLCNGVAYMAKDTSGHGMLSQAYLELKGANQSSGDGALVYLSAGSSDSSWTKLGVSYLKFGGTGLNETKLEANIGLHIPGANDATADYNYDSISIARTDGASLSLSPSGMQLNSSDGKNATVNPGYISITDGSGTVIISPPSGETASFRQITVCYGGDMKTAWVLMTEPS